MIAHQYLTVPYQVPRRYRRNRFKTRGRAAVQRSVDLGSGRRERERPSRCPGKKGSNLLFGSDNESAVDVESRCVVFSNTKSVIFNLKLGTREEVEMAATNRQTGTVSDGRGERTDGKEGTSMGRPAPGAASSRCSQW